jgi:hypothetical protein
MNSLHDTAPAFVAMAHEIVWCTVATTDREGRARTRILHPLWLWDGEELTGWIATSPTPLKVAHLDAHPYVSCNYWTTTQDTCSADGRAEWARDDATCTTVWNLFKEAPAPVGYDPAIVPAWADGPTSPAFAALRVYPERLRVFPGTVLLQGTGDVLTWTA